MKTHTGFTLIEVLIAMLVLAIGLLGLATLQTYSLRANLSAYTRGQATQLLYDMSDRMRANTAAAKASTSTTGYLITNTNTDTRTASATINTSTEPCRLTTNTTCDAAALAKYDLIEWKTAVASTLPMGIACITSNANNEVFTLYITWDDNRSGDVKTDIAPNACTTITTVDSTEKYPDPILTMSVQL
ncbi:hypothetical protein DOJK_00751 [Patescibacteria group bacterium]|nr:hypothetical protein DOJK_00751 [Patescibacteria group bacterium]